MGQNILKKEAKNADVSTEKASSVLKLSDFYSEKRRTITFQLYKFIVKFMIK